MPAQTVWGLDIGESGLKAVKMARGKKFLEVVRVDMIPITAPGGAEEAAVGREALVIQALEEFVRRHDPFDSRIVASVQGRSTFCKPISLAPVEQKRIPEIVRFEVKQQIPFPIEDIVWDYFKCKESFAPGEEIEVNLIAIRKEIVENFTEMFTRAGIRVDVLQAAPLALYNLVKYEYAPQGNVVIIDIGAEIADLIIVEGDRFWPRTLPIAGKQITKALEEKFEIPFDEAEKLKLTAADSKNYQQIFTVMRPVLKELVGEIHRTIGYYKSLSKDVVFDKIIFMGNATKLSGFEKFFGENLPYKIEIVQGLQKLRVSRRLNLAAFREYLPGFAVALGLAIQGLQESKCNVNLLPEEISGKVRPGKVLAMIAAIVIVLLAYPASMVIANIGKQISDGLAKAYDRIPERGVPSLLEVKRVNDDAIANIDKAQGIQNDAQDKFLKPFRTAALPRYVMEEIARLAPRDKEVKVVSGLGEARKDMADNACLITVNYIAEWVTPPAPRPGAAGAAKTPPPAPKLTIRVEITGITKTVNNSLPETRKWVDEQFTNKLINSSLSAPVPPPAVPASAEAKFMTSDFWNSGEKREEGIKEFAVFKITWQINPDAAATFEEKQ